MAGGRHRDDPESMIWSSCVHLHCSSSSETWVHVLGSGFVESQEATVQRDLFLEHQVSIKTHR